MSHNPPRHYKLDDPAEVHRLHRETLGYLKTCLGRKCGTDLEGREFAIAALSSLVNKGFDADSNGLAAVTNNLPLLVEMGGPDRAQVAAMFAKPEPIAPLPPETAEEAVRRAMRDTPLSGLKVSAKVRSILVREGHQTLADVGKALGLAIVDEEPMPGLDRIQTRGVEEAIDDFHDFIASEWVLAHDGPAAPFDPHPDDTDPAEDVDQDDD
jgi:hypothetical protein